jgi:thiol-disulfide isomerase/thioredoxin
LSYSTAERVYTLFEHNGEIEQSLGCAPEKIGIVPNGVHMERFAHIGELTEHDGPLTIGAVVRVVPIKDVVTLLRAFFLVKQEMTDAELDEYLLTDQAHVIYDVIAVCGLPRTDLDEFISTLRTPEIPEDHPQDELFSTFIHQKDIVLENGWELLVQRMEQFNADGTPAEDLVPESLPEENREEVRKLLEDVELFCSGIEETAYSAPGDVGSTISFTGTDLDGNEVSSADLFAGSDVTMINVWATWCPPCKAELPDLAKLNTQFAEKNCQIIGLCLDAEDALETAQQLVKDSGYVNVVGKMTADFDWAQSCTAIPTSFFVDSKGKILIDPIVGAMVKAYPQALEDALTQID